MKKTKKQQIKEKFEIINLSKTLFKMAIPIMICHVLNTLFGVVDMIWIGRLGAEELAAISWATNVLIVLVTFIVGISTGTTAIITRNIGASKYDEASRTAFHSLVIGAVFSIILAVAGFFFIEDVLFLLGAELYVAQLGAEYLKIIFLFSIIWFFMYMLSAILQGEGNVKVPTITLVVAAIINIILDPLLIFGIGFFPKLGVKGAAIATVIAKIIGLCICIIYFFKGDNKIKICLSFMKINFKIISRILKIGIPSSLQLVMRTGVGLVLMILVGTFGYKAVAAYGIGLRLFSLAMMLAFGLGNAASILVGQYLGAKKVRLAVKIAVLSASYNAVVMGAIAICYIIFAIPLVKLFNSDLEVVRIGVSYIKITTIGYVFAGIGFVLGKSLNGAGDTTTTMIVTLICLWFIQVPLALFYTVFWKLDVTGIWWAIVLAIILQALVTMILFAQGKWRTKKV